MQWLSEVWWWGYFRCSGMAILVWPLVRAGKLVAWTSVHGAQIESCSSAVHLLICGFNYASNIVILFYSHLEVSDLAFLSCPVSWLVA